jgi:hypothetical protein
LGKSFEVSLLDELAGVFDELDCTFLEELDSALLDELEAVALDEFSFALEDGSALDECCSFDDELSLARLLEDVFSLARLLDDEF